MRLPPWWSGCSRPTAAFRPAPSSISPAAAPPIEDFLMALAGDGAICIWNDIADESRDDFYAWHLTEHMPERTAIPGFRRGRRYIACDAATRPEFFTLYETVD